MTRRPGPRLRDRQGVALLLVLIALLCMGAFAAAVWLVGFHELRVAGTAAARTRAVAAADEGTWAPLREWRSAGHGRLAVGWEARFAGQAGGALGVYRGTVHRLSALLYLVESEGVDARGRSRQRVGRLVRVRPLRLTIDAALRTAGPARLARGARVSGEDQPPVGWGCRPPGPALPGVRLPPGSRLDLECPRGGCVTGEPPVLVDSSPRMPGLIAGVELTTLRQLADKVLGPGLRTVGPSQVAGRCRYGDPSNWGDPDRPGGVCGAYSPLIWVEGDLRVHGGRGQGILVVDGDLAVSGGFRFYGPVLVLGQFDTTGEGGHFKGGVVATTVGVAQSDLGGAAVSYSSCAVRRAAVAQGEAQPLVERSWLWLYRIP